MSCGKCRQRRQRRKRFVVEATWNGYTSAQSHVVHREVQTIFREGYEAIGFHRFNDGTTLDVTVRDAKPREHVQEIHGYTNLLTELAFQNYKAQKKAAS